jgi:hypothetical protein
MQRKACGALSSLPLAVALLWSSPCVGQQAGLTTVAETIDVEAAKRFQAHAKETAGAYEIRTDSATGRKLMLREEPILRWTNPVPERQMHGDVFLWTDEGRPAAVLCLFEMTENGFVRECHEFCSLATGGLKTNGPAGRNWSPAEGQVAMRPLADAPPPAATARQRLIQVRELATRFACEKTTRMGDVRRLRLLSQPVARYESLMHDVADGALFAFVEATDPEVFLLLETRPSRGAAQWHYGLARMVSVQAKVSLGKETVWEVETLPYDGYRNRADRPYVLLFAR